MSKHGWTYKKLTDVSEIQYGFAFDSNYFCEDNSYPQLIRIRDVVRGFSETFFRGEVPDNYWVNKGEYLIGMDGEFNIAPWQSDRALLNQRVCKITSKNSDCLIRFIYYNMQSILKAIEDETPFVTVKHLSAKKLNAVKLPVPPMAEQEAIVAELDEINEAIAALQQQVADLDTLAQSTFYDMFGDPVTNPKAWPVKKLGELSTVKTGPFGSMLHKEDYIVNGIPLVNPVHMRNFKIVPDMSFTIPEHKAQELSNYLLRSNDIVFARRGDIGRCAVVSNEQDGFLCGTGSLFVRFNENVDSIFTMYVIRSESFTNSLLSAAKGATMLNINSTVVENLNFILPPLALQQEFAARVEAIEAAKAELNAQIAEMQTLLVSRMDYYFD